MLFPVRRCVDRLWRGMFQQSITKKAVGLVFICALAWYVIMGVLSFTSSTQSGGFQGKFLYKHAILSLFLKDCLVYSVFYDRSDAW